VHAVKYVFILFIARMKSLSFSKNAKYISNRPISAIRVKLMSR